MMKIINNIAAVSAYMKYKKNALRGTANLLGRVLSVWVEK